jgi:hypothetical protein
MARPELSPAVEARMVQSPGVRFVIINQGSEELLGELGGVDDERSQFLYRLSRPAPSGGPAPDKRPEEAMCYLAELVAGALEVIQAQRERIERLEADQKPRSSAKK